MAEPLWTGRSPVKPGSLAAVPVFALSFPVGFGGGALIVAAGSPAAVGALVSVTCLLGGLFLFVHLVDTEMNRFWFYEDFVRLEERRRGTWVTDVPYTELRALAHASGVVCFSCVTKGSPSGRSWAAAVGRSHAEDVVDYIEEVQEREEALQT